MRQFYLLLAAIYFVNSLTAQTKPGIWTPVAPDAVVLPAGAEREFEPYRYVAFQLAYDDLIAVLATAPAEFTEAAQKTPCTVLLPRADGRLERFALCNSPVMTPATAARHPEIQTFTGFSMEEPGTKIKCSYSLYLGFKALIRRTDKGIEYIERLAKGQNTYYMVYDRKSFPMNFGPLV